MDIVIVILITLLCIASYLLGLQSGRYDGFDEGAEHAIKVYAEVMQEEQKWAATGLREDA